MKSLFFFMSNLSVILEESAGRYPQKDAIIFCDKHFSYEEINSSANQVANGLQKLGVQRGDKVALACINNPIFPVIYFGILKTGAVVVPINILLKRNEIAFQLQISESKVFLCFFGSSELPLGKEGFAAFQETESCSHFFFIMPKKGEPSPEEGIQTYEDFIADQPLTFQSIPCSEEDTAAILFTSGTTGRPKGAELTHSNFLLDDFEWSRQLALTHDDICLLVLPLFHIFGMGIMIGSVRRGNTMVIVSKFDAAEVFKAFQKYRVTFFSGVPTMYINLLNYKGDLDVKKLSLHLRICMSAGAPLLVPILNEFKSRFNVNIQEGYGMSECICATINPLAGIFEKGSVGIPLSGIDIKIVDENDHELSVGERGELCVRGYNVMKGYYNNPEATSQTIRNGWLHSGDIAIKDEDGYIYIVDRKKDMIIRGGFKVYPREVEEIMLTHEAVAMVAVIGVPHDTLGEEIKAFVIRKREFCISEQELLDWTKAKIASFKYPRLIEFVDSLPLSATGKILKRELRR